MLIEAIIFLLIITFCFTWWLFMFISKKIKLWRYKPENDKGKRAEESRRCGGLQRTLLPTSSERFDILPTASVDIVGEIKSIIRKTGDSSRKTTNPFLRR